MESKYKDVLIKLCSNCNDERKKIYEKLIRNIEDGELRTRLKEIENSKQLSFF